MKYRIFVIDNYGFTDFMIVESVEALDEILKSLKACKMYRFIGYRKILKNGDYGALQIVSYNQVVK